jgi:mannitol/fructose-specific phosphotransferase system IIA component (Ntr-type)
MSIKKSALQQLSPLVDQLDQTPDEKFKTMLMMIQASDDKSMISSAYQIAQKITDEKAKAQALLDIVNEINYFTQSVETE